MDFRVSWNPVFVSAKDGLDHIHGSFVLNRRGGGIVGGRDGVEKNVVVSNFVFLTSLDICFFSTQCVSQG